MDTLKQTFLRGMITVLPVALTIGILYWLGLSLERVLGGLIQFALPDLRYVPGIGLLVAIVLTFCVGVVMEAWVARRLMRLGERVIESTPLAKTVYSAIRDVIGYIQLSGDEKRGGAVVSVSLSNETSVVGFITNESTPFGTNENWIPVYVPMSYQLGGFTVMTHRDNLQKLDVTKEEAMRWVLTAGVSAKRKTRA